MKHKHMKALSVLLTVCLLVGLVPWAALPARATTEQYSSLIPTASDDAAALAAKVVTFNGIGWYIIKDESTAADAGTVTLFAKDPIGAVKFNESDAYNNNYNSSSLKTFLDNLTQSGGSFEGVADTIVAVDLTDVSVTDAKLWPLSEDEAFALPVEVRKCSTAHGSNWWLRTASSKPSTSKCAWVKVVQSDNGGQYENPDAPADGGVKYSFAVRPALKLDLSKVAFDNNAFFLKQTIEAAEVTATYGDTDRSVSASVTDPATGGGAISYAVKAGSENYIDVNADTGTLTIKAVPTDGKAYVTVTAAASGNYGAATTDVTVTISKKEVAVSGITAASREYDGTTDATLNASGASFDGMVVGDALTVSGTGTFEDASAGTNKTVNITGLTLGGASASNYVLSATNATGTGTITARPVTITAENQTVELNGTVDTSTSKATLTGAAEGHALDSVTLTPDPTSTAAATTSGTITPSNAVIKNGDTDVTANYEISYVNGTLTVNKATPTVTAPTANASLTYDGTAQALLSTEAATTGGTLQYAVTASDAASAPTDGWGNSATVTSAGNYKVWYKVVGDANYGDVAAASVDVSIAKKPVTVSGITAEGREYDGTTDATLVTTGAVFAGICGGDALTVSGTGTFADADAGDGKTVNISNLTLGGTDAGNYVLAESGQQTSTTANITPKSVTAAVAPTPSAYTYDGTEKKPEVTVKDGETTIPAEEYTVSYSNNVNAGTATVTVTDKEGGSYIVNGSTTFTINPKPVTITGLSASEKVYDGTTTATVTGTAVIDGKVGSDDVSVDTSAGTATFDSADVGTGKTVTFSGYALSGTAAGNYTLSGQPANETANITAKSITGATVTLSATQLGCTGSEQSVSVTGVTLDGKTLTTADYDVSGTTGTAKDNYTVTVTGKGNYKDTATATWAITDKPMTVSAPDVTVTADGQPHGITVNVTDPASGATVKYGTEEGSYTFDASPTQTEVGTLTVYYQVTADNYTAYTGSATVTVRNKPAPPAPTTYSVTVNNGTGGGSYTAGATVTITADAAPEGKVFDKWTGSVSFADATSASTTFTMPASAVTVTATYKDKPSIADMTVYDIPDQSSTGEQITPKPVVKYLGHLLTEGTDYELSYGKNTELGEGTVTITGKGNYTGSLTKTFKIVLAAYGGTLTVAAPGAYTYGDALGAAPAVTSSAGSLSGETVKVYYSATPSGEGTAWDSGAKLNAGTYYVWAELAKTAKHDAATSGRVQFTVNKATPAAPAGVLAASYTDTYKVMLSIPGEKTYADYEYSLDGASWTSVPALKDGAFTPAGLSAGTTYTLSFRTKADSNNNASAAATATLKTPAKVLLSYDANGSTATVPASAEYDSGATVTAAAAITRAGYTFAGWNTAANGGGTAYAAGAAFTISANTTLYAQWTPNTYNVAYHGNGATDPAAVNGVAYNAEITLPTPTYAEHTFNGWATVSGGNPVYRGGQKVTGLTSVSGATVDLYAVWTENTYKITGEVKEERDGTTEQSIVAGVTVKIMRGSVEFAATATDDYGKYTFSGVPAGTYNIVATRTADSKTQTMTALVEVKDSNKSVETIVLPPSGVNSALKVTGDSTPPVMVGGLDDVAKDEAEENKEVTVTMTVEQKDENTATEQQKQEMEEIKEAVAADSTTGEGRTELEFLDVKVEKKTEDGSTTTTEPITETSQVVEMIVPFNMNGRFGFSLYRHHDGKAEAFRSMSSRFAKGSFADGYFFADKAAGLFYIYTSRFSTYAIGYEEGTGYTLTVNSGTGGGEFAVGATITITADDPAAGKVFDKWTTGDGVDFADETASTTTFVMPAKNVTVTATYKDAPVTTYTATVVSGTGSGSYAAGASVTIKANAAPSGKVFDKWVSSDGVSFANANSSTTTFTMPAKNVTVTATYKTASSPAPYYPGGGGNYTPTTYPPIVADAQHGKVTVSPTNPTSGTTVTITAKPDAGYEVDTVTVADASGKSVSVKDNGNNIYSFTQPSSKVTVKVTFKPVSSPTNDVFAPFSDLSTASWYADGVRYVLEHGIMSGMGDGLFQPSGTTTRAQLAQILYNIESKPAVAGALNYTDVNPTYWYVDAIRWADANGIMGGFGNGTFGPDVALTREQLVTILYRYARYKGIDVSAQASLAAYNDTAGVSDWAREAMQWAVGSGLISGKTASTLNPQDKASRAEIATIIMRYCENVAN